MISERLFEDVLVKYPELIEDSLKFVGRQVNHYGKRIDILFEDRFKEKLIIELKKDNLDRNALSQVMEYEGYILSEKDPSARVMLIANRIPLNLKKAMDHHGIEYKEITHRQIFEFLEKRDEQLLKSIQSQDKVESTYKLESVPIKPTNFSLTTRASMLDAIILAGGTWGKLIAKADFESNRMGKNQKYTIAILKTHIRYRTVVQNNPDYLKNFNITEEGIFLKSGKIELFEKSIIGIVTNVKARKDTKDRFEIWFNRSSEKRLPYGKTTNPEGIPIKIKIHEKIYSIGFHNTETCIWISARLYRDGYSLTDFLKSHSI